MVNYCPNGLIRTRNNFEIVDVEREDDEGDER